MIYMGRKRHLEKVLNTREIKFRIVKKVMGQSNIEIHSTKTSNSNMFRLMGVRNFFIL